MTDMRFLPSARFRQLEGGSGRQPASRINSLANDPRELTGTVAARGALLPILYGRRDIPGLIFAVGTISTDLVVGVIWCVGEIDAVEAIYINDAIPPAGVTVTHYTGTAVQGVDATLASAVTAYNDSLRFSTPDGLRGVAYSVVRITAAAEIDAWPRIRATVRGRKVLDPRTSLTAYSDNSALCLADLIRDRDYGLSLDVTGVTECANWCDFLLGDVIERCRLALYIAEGRQPDAYVDLLAEYAECFWIRDGAGIKLIPDAPVDLDLARRVTTADIIQDSFSLSGESSLNTPTEVEVQYTEPASPVEEPWGLASAVQVLPGVETGDVSRVPTNLNLEGVFRAEEANNKALARLLRLQNRMTASWTTLDAAVAHQTGDVVVVEHPARGIDSLPIRIESVDLVAAGRYRVAGSFYSHDHYPTEVQLPENLGIVPIGAIVLMSGTTTPAGWEAYTAADGKYVLGAGGDYAVNATGGEATFSWSGATTTNGAHSSATHTSLGFFKVTRYVSGGTEFGFLIGGPTGDPAHSHTAAIATMDPEIYTRAARLIQKTGSSSTVFPRDSQIFGLAELQNPAISRVLSSIGRLIKAASTNANAGATSKSVAVTTGVTSNLHQHGTPANFSNLDYTLDFAPFEPRYSSQSGGGDHSHTVTVSLDRRLKRRRLAMYSGSAEYRVVPGTIIMWAGSLASLPEDWVLCDGSGATPDMRDHFVEIAELGNELTTTGDHKMALSGTSNSVSHTHRSGSSFTSSITTTQNFHNLSHSHNHQINAEPDWMPTYHALAFLMYSPGV